MVLKNVQTLAEFELELTKNLGVLAYFSHEQCNVCQVLKPKVKELLGERFPQMAFVDVDVMQHPEVAGQFRVFASPTIVAFFDGKEAFRVSRSFGMDELAGKIERPYGLVFG